MPKPKPPKASATRSGRKPSRARHHGRTFCKRCLKKIAFGNAFCNKRCYVTYLLANK